jgi:hypothetical protein
MSDWTPEKWHSVEKHLRSVNALAVLVNVYIDRNKHINLNRNAK